MVATLDDTFPAVVAPTYSGIKDREFKDSMLILNERATELKEDGKGKKSSKVDSISAKEEGIL